MGGPTRESLIEDLQRLGIKAGDVVYYRVDLSAVGLSPKRYLDFFETTLEFAGPEGTIVCPTFTRAGHPSLMDKSKPFDLTTPSHSGGWLARMFLNHPDVVRSAHPVNSFAAIGKHAEYICAEHDETKPGCWPTSRMMELDAKQPIIGCVESNPGFITVHWAQYLLGLALRMRRKGDYGVYYRKADEVKLFVADHRGGCSLGFGGFYPEYERRGILTSGRVGDAYSICATMRETFEIEEEILKKNPRFALCDDPWCRKCRTLWEYNRRDVPMYYVRHALRRLARQVGAY